MTRDGCVMVCLPGSAWACIAASYLCDIVADIEAPLDWNQKPADPEDRQRQIRQLLIMLAAAAADVSPTYDAELTELRIGIEKLAERIGYTDTDLDRHLIQSCIIRTDDVDRLHSKLLYAINLKAAKTRRA